ncbi:putative PBP superfamily domain-containing protein [uncultured Thiomicrorhabdus sp.]
MRGRIVLVKLLLYLALVQPVPLSANGGISVDLQDEVTMIANVDGTHLVALTGKESSLGLNMVDVISLRQKYWPDGTPIQLYVLPNNHEATKGVVRQVMQLNESWLQRIWNRKIFSGAFQAPIVIDNEYQMIKRVLKHPKSIGYVSTGVFRIYQNVLNVQQANSS